MKEDYINKGKLLMNIGNNFCHLRREKDLTQEYLSEKADMSSDFLSRIERGTTNLTIYKFICLVNALDSTPNHIMCDFIKNKEQVADEMLAFEMPKLSSRNRKLILEIIKIIKNLDM